MEAILYTTAALLHCDDMPGWWVSWCPELDIVSQGKGPENALAMIADAIRLEVDMGLTSTLVLRDRDGVNVVHQKRVELPQRRISKVSGKDDEHWPDFCDWDGLCSNWISVKIRDLTPEDGIAFVEGNLLWRSRGGIIMVDYPDYGVHASIRRNS